MIIRLRTFCGLILKLLEIVNQIKRMENEIEHELRFMIIIDVNFNGRIPAALTAPRRHCQFY